MSNKTLSAIPITESDMKEQLNSATMRLKSASFAITPEVDENDPSRYEKMLNKETVTVSIYDLVHGIDASDDLLSDTQLHALRAIRSGLQIGRHVAKDYGDRAGISALVSSMTSQQKTERNEKRQTAAAIASFVMARYVLSDMQELLNGNAFIDTVNVRIDEVDLTRISSSLQAATFFLGRNIEKQARGDDARLVAIVIKYAAALQQEILIRVPSLKHTQFFTDIAYHLEKSEFGISGFELTDLSAAKSVDFNHIQIDTMVGNREAKHFAKRIVSRMIAYDFAAQKNPFQELGAFLELWMGYALPGTGKSMLIAIISTMLYEYCEKLGIPYVFNPMPDTLVSTFQGGSAEHAVDWFRPMLDPNHLIFSPVDDAENNLEDRTRQGISAGVREIIGVFLRYTEGAYAINHGNSTMGLMTNLPEQLDKAVLSRVQSRFTVNGAETVEDMLDQDYLWWKKYDDISDGFVGMTNPGYVWMSDQGLVHSLGEVASKYDEPQEGRILDIYNRVLRNYDPAEHMFFAELYHGVKQEFPGFASRDIRNIQKAVSLRIMDFDLPDEWLEERRHFVDLDYDTKLDKLKKLMKENMADLDFANIRRQEVIKYLDNMVRIADADYKRRIDAGVEAIRLHFDVQEQARKEEVLPKAANEEIEESVA